MGLLLLKDESQISVLKISHFFNSSRRSLEGRKMSFSDSFVTIR